MKPKGGDKPKAQTRCEARKPGLPGRSAQSDFLFRIETPSLKKGSVVRERKYEIEILPKLLSALKAAPALPPKFVSQTEIVTEVAPVIRELHGEKNYDAKQIHELLKTNGLKITLRDVKNVLFTQQNKAKKAIKAEQ